MGSRPSVSVLLPTMPDDPWLDDALASLLDQISDVDLEVILIRDGPSSHGSRDLVEHPAVRTIVRDSPQGLGAALNAGIRECTHEFVARLDSDDVCMGGRLARQAEYLVAHPLVAVVGTGAFVMDEHSERTGVCLGAGLAGNVRKALLYKNPLVHPSVMFRKSIVIGVGGYDESMSRVEDYELWLRVAARAEVHSIEQAFVEYRVHGNQMSRKLPTLHDYSRIASSRIEFARRNDLGALPLIVSFGRSFVSHATWATGLRKLSYRR
ncbi:glycosyltransferase [Janibacter sp. FSL W8-0316]|uniref:glycosyltransferase n=1 Tax=Janibacter sp. FSL W8-0316 TaxID=2975325 RepID=UPI004046E3C9